MGLFARRKPHVDAARALYGFALRQARAPAFFAPGRAPDTLAGRYEVLMLHVFLVVDRLSREGEDAKALGQAVFDTFFEDMDSALREAGVGDVTVGKRIKTMGEAFYGRANAYRDALVQPDAAALNDAVGRNFFAHQAGGEDGDDVTAVAEYARACHAALAAQPLGEFLSGGEPCFAPPPA